MLPGIENKEQPQQGTTYEREMVPMDGPDGVTRHVPVYRSYGPEGPTLITAAEYRAAESRGDQTIEN